MSTTDIRYIIQEGSGYGSGFIVQDQVEKREVCGCALRKDAGMIAGVLNRDDEKNRYDDEVARELGG